MALDDGDDTFFKMSYRRQGPFHSWAAMSVRMAAVVTAALVVSFAIFIVAYAVGGWAVLSLGLLLLPLIPGLKSIPRWIPLVARQRRLVHLRTGRSGLSPGSPRRTLAYGAYHEPRQPGATPHPLRPG